jgi:hypothetical protein
MIITRLDSYPDNLPVRVRDKMTCAPKGLVTAGGRAWPQARIWSGRAGCRFRRPVVLHYALTGSSDAYGSRVHASGVVWLERRDRS